jgi:hypothetical protein
MQQVAGAGVWRHNPKEWILPGKNFIPATKVGCVLIGGDVQTTLEDCGITSYHYAYQIGILITVGNCLSDSPTGRHGKSAQL